MGEEKPERAPIQLCSMRIAFPVTSDEQAIAYKKKVGDILADLDSVRMSFDLTSVPVSPKLPNGNL